jgi:hypothetical protein
VNAMRLATVPRAIGFGVGAGAAALLLWVLHLNWPRIFVVPYVLALMATAACGIFILLVTWYDSYRNPRRGVRIRPIRGFDIVTGLLLAVPSLWGLYPFLPAL